MKIGILTQRERDFSKKIKGDVANFIKEIKNKYREPDVDHFLTVELLNLLTFILAGNNVNRQEVVSEFDRHMEHAEQHFAVKRGGHG